MADTHFFCFNAKTIAKNSGIRKGTKVREVLIGFFLGLVLSITGCYSRQDDTQGSTGVVSRKPPVADPGDSRNTPNPGDTRDTRDPGDSRNTRYNSAPLHDSSSAEEGNGGQYSTLPATIVTDLTVPECIVTTYDNSRPYADSHGSGMGPKGFDDGAGTSALNLHRELMSRGRPHDASNRVSDPTIPSAIPTDEVAINTDYRQPSSYGAYNAGTEPSNEIPAEVPAPEVSETRISETSIPARDGGSTYERRYTVNRGDTLYSIARMHQVTVGQILSANDNLNNPDELYAGQDLLIP
jgi:hypothetical protein